MNRTVGPGVTWHAAGHAAAKRRLGNQNQHVSLVSSACFLLIQNTLLQLGACGGQDRLSCALGRNETGIKVNKKPLIRLLGLSKWQWESLPNYCPYYQRERESEIESKRAWQREGLRGGMKSVTHTNTILIPSDCFVLHFNLSVAAAGTG